MSNLVERHATHIMNTFGPPRLGITGGQGCYLLGEDGRRYLDLLGGIAVSALGHGHPALAAAITRQAADVVHVSNFFATRPQVELAQRLTALAPFAPAQVFFANSGTEAIEGALKLALLHGGQHRPRLLALENAFHGRSTGALALTHKAAYREPFAPFMRPVTFLPAGDVSALERELSQGDVAALFVEPIQGEAGVRALEHRYLRAARELTSAADALLVVDEIQTGVGRTGRFFAHSAAEISPDVITLAKGLGGGVPIGAILATAAVASLLGPGSHGTTFGGNPLACAAALAVLDVIAEEHLLERVQELAGRWARELAQLPGVTEVRAHGLLLALELDRTAGPVAAALQEAGFLVNPVTPTALRLAPPLTLSDAEADSFTHALHTVLTREENP
ncbi:acetylornithine transaminase [Buchananella hordeovulneris]|uniref:acetylornithine transaminase n=1 Tax=Buchananella hordeovulneris TaxID=52770 RepID=UPI0026DADAAD|nr:acetylornithine transaminase [Buchananella hordeovulneris]MDO5081043.1 acetylornithine transaminase [Buchananella hordeovulneris]